MILHVSSKVTIFKNKFLFLFWIQKYTSCTFFLPVKLRNFIPRIYCNNLFYCISRTICDSTHLFYCFWIKFCGNFFKFLGIFYNLGPGELLFKFLLIKSYSNINFSFCLLSVLYASFISSCPFNFNDFICFHANSTSALLLSIFNIQSQLRSSEEYIQPLPTHQKV